RNPRPETRNPKADTRNPEPEASKPETSTVRRRSDTRNPRPETRNPKADTRNPEPEASKPETSTVRKMYRTPKPQQSERDIETRNLMTLTTNTLKSAASSQQWERGTPQPRSNPETRNPKADARKDSDTPPLSNPGTVPDPKPRSVQTRKPENLGRNPSPDGR
ncbi:hypothetical protein T484DRAFT_3628812, partial [Baffinella frigidus]